MNFKKFKKVRRGVELCANIAKVVYYTIRAVLLLLGE